MTKIKSGSITANGNKVEFLTKGKGPLLLCLHGFPDHAHSFESQIEFFSNRGFRVIAPFMRGYGPELSETEPTFTAFDTGRDALALIDAFGYDNAVILGHDWGANAAYAAAFLAPEKVQKLITAAVPYGRQFGGALLSDAEQQRRSWYMFFFLAPFAEAAVAHNNFAFLDRLWADWSPNWTANPHYMAKLKATLSKPGALSNSLSYYRNTFGKKPTSVDQKQFAAEFAKLPINVSTLYLHGINDGCISADLNLGMEDLFPKGLKTLAIQDAGHFLHLEKPDVFNTHLANFLNV